MGLCLRGRIHILRGKAGTTATARDDPVGRLVSIGTIPWNAFAEHEEILTLFKANGIQGSFDGSLLHDIVVPRNQATRTFGLLKTNRLVIEKKVSLSDLPKDVPP